MQFILLLIGFRDNCAKAVLLFINNDKMKRLLISSIHCRFRKVMFLLRSLFLKRLFLSFYGSWEISKPHKYFPKLKTQNVRMYYMGGKLLQTCLSRS